MITRKKKEELTNGLYDTFSSLSDNLPPDEEYTQILLRFFRTTADLVELLKEEE